MKYTQQLGLRLISGLFFNRVLRESHPNGGRWSVCLCVFHVYNYSHITLYILEVKNNLFSV